MSVRIRHLAFLSALIVWPNLSSQAADSVTDSAIAAIQWQHRVIDSMTIEYTGADEQFLPQLERYLGNSLGEVQGFFAREFPQPFTVWVFSGRSKKNYCVIGAHG